jgi:hypothetical protein
MVQNGWPFPVSDSDQDRSETERLEKRKKRDMLFAF